MGLKLAAGLTLDNGLRPQAIAGVAPTLDYRFARDKRETEAVSLTDKLTFTGGNQGTFVGSDGYIQRATTNVPRFDHDPVSLVSEGLLVEASRTNSIRNNTMVGAVAGTPGTLPTNWAASSTAGGLTREIVGIWSAGNISYIRFRITGTTNTSNVFFAVSTFDSVSAATGQAWTGSVYCRLHSGSLTGVTLQQEFGRFTPAYVGSIVLPFTPGSAALGGQRYTLSIITTDAALTSLTYGLQLFVPASGTAVDFALDIGLPQLEQGATASTPIPTTTTAVTRTADSAVIDGTGVLTGTYTMVAKPEGSALVSGSTIVLQPGYTAERVMVFPAALSAAQITAIRSAM